MPHVDTPQSLCRFGIDRGDVTPPVGIYHRLWGAATHERAAGVHRPLTATALVLRAAGMPAGPETEQVVVAVEAAAAVPAEEDVARRLHDALARHDAVAGALVLRAAEVGLEDRRRRLLELQDQRVLLVAAEEEIEPAPRRPKAARRVRWRSAPMRASAAVRSESAPRPPFR